MNSPNAQPITVLCRQGITPRLAYTLKIIGEAITGIPAEPITDELQFKKSAGVRLVYGGDSLPGTPWIPATGLLYETGTDAPRPELKWRHGMPVLFCDDTGSEVAFDYPAAIFWMLSRYEEYQPFTPDQHNRFQAPCSLLYQHNLLETPLVELWHDHFSSILINYFPWFKPMEHPYRFIPTIDVDSAWAYRHKPFHLQAGGVVKSLFRGQWKETLQRTKTLSGLQRDPYDTFDEIMELHKGIEQPTWFFLLGNYNAYNKNQRPRNRQYQRLIRVLNKRFNTGLHPSYETSENPGQLSEEIRQFTSITGTSVVRSRQHFLRFHLPQTYRLLLCEGISEEYSMGFADAPGFRAGTCRPFPFYDLTAEQETSLVVYPLALMDGTLHDYLALDSDAAKSKINTLSTVIRRHGGVMVTLWHNSSFDSNKSWKGWKTVYSHLLESCTSTR